MRIKIKQGLSGPAYSYSAGDIVDLPQKKAIKLCEAGIAQPVKEKEIEKQTKPQQENQEITFSDLNKKAGGWFEFPDGKNVRGEEAAKERLKKLNGG